MIYIREKSRGVVTLLLLTLIAFIAIAPTQGQTSANADHFVYEVQRGDTLVLTALHYNIPLADIVLANDLTHPYLLFPGQKLILPGVPSPPEPLLSELPPLRDEPHVVQAGESLFNIATQYDVTMGALTLVNNLANPDVIQAGQALHIPVIPPQPAPLTAPFVEISLSEPTIIQGRTLVIQVTLSEPGSLTGTFEGRPLFFEDAGPQQMWSIVGIHALTEPNLYPVSLTATLADGRTVSAFVNVEVVEGPYESEEIRLDGERSGLLNEELIEQEREKLVDLWSQISPRPRWDGPFGYPVAPTELRITSQFGTRRSYNGSPTTTFHGGTDFGGGTGLPIYAPAPGQVVLAERLTLRGNAVLIDHGMGLFSGYWHQSQLAVEAGQTVQTGDLIGYTGDTGLVTGPHLHWEMRLQGIAVEPMQWVQEAIP